MSKGDVISTSKGPSAIGKDSLEDHPGDDPTTSDDVEAGTQAAPYQGKVSGKVGEGRDLDEVHERVRVVSGVNINNFGDITYTEGVEISDEDVTEIDTQFTGAGAEAGAGRAVAMAARQMGYGVKFTARKADA